MPGGVPPSARKDMNTTSPDSSCTAHPDSLGIAPNVDPHSVRVATGNDSKRCHYRYSNGKRCRLSGSKSHFGLCSHHFSLSNNDASQQRYTDTEDLSGELFPELSEFESAVDINKFLAKLLVLVTKGRVSPRRAAVLAYITNQLLHSHRVINREADAHPTVIWDVPGVSTLPQEKSS